MSLKVNEILVEPAPAAEVAGKGLLSSRVVSPIKLNADVLRKNLSTFIDAMNEMVSGLPKLTEPFNLNEIAIVVEVNAEGSLQLVGGIKVGASGGITLKLTR